MKKLKCENCGANLKIEDNNEYAYCEYCNLKYKLNEDSNIDSETYNYAYKIVNKISIIIIVAIIGFFLLLATILIFLGTSKEKKYSNNKKHIINIKYNEIEINDSNDIKNLKQKLEDKDYEVVFDYDKDGFINKITLEDI